MTEIDRIVEGLTKAQRALLSDTVDRQGARKGFVINGLRGCPARALQKLGLIEIVDVWLIFDRVNLALRPLPLGQSVRAALIEREPHS